MKRLFSTAKFAIPLANTDTFGSWHKVQPPSGASTFVGAPAIVYRSPTLFGRPLPTRTELTLSPED
jgi:hypothetical protein